MTADWGCVLSVKQQPGASVKAKGSLRRTPWRIRPAPICEIQPEHTNPHDSLSRDRLFRELCNRNLVCKARLSRDLDKLHLQAAASPTRPHLRGKNEDDYIVGNTVAAICFLRNLKTEMFFAYCAFDDLAILQAGRFCLRLMLFEWQDGEMKLKAEIETDPFVVNASNEPLSLLPHLDPTWTYTSQKDRNSGSQRRRSVIPIASQSGPTSQQNDMISPFAESSRLPGRAMTSPAVGMQQNPPPFGYQGYSGYECLSDGNGGIYYNPYGVQDLPGLASGTVSPDNQNLNQGQSTPFDTSYYGMPMSNEPSQFQYQVPSPERPTFSEPLHGNCQLPYPYYQDQHSQESALLVPPYTAPQPNLHQDYHQPPFPVEAVVPYISQFASDCHLSPSYPYQLAPQDLSQQHVEYANSGESHQMPARPHHARSFTEPYNSHGISSWHRWHQQQQHQEYPYQYHM